MVTDMGGIDDKSFNASAWAGMETASEELGVEVAYLESQQQPDYAVNITQFLDQEYDMIVTVGFLLGEDTATFADQSPGTMFAIVDYAYDPTIPNVLGLTFATDEAAFLAGYAAAGMSKTGKVGTFGGIEIPPVTIFMTGYKAGVDYYNAQHGTNVDVLGMDLFVGNFESTDDGRRAGEDLIAEGADVIMPVAGPVGLGTAAAVQENPGTMLVGVDTDWCVSAAEYCDVTLTSVMKNIDVAVGDAIKMAVDGNFAGGVYVGTIANDGVGLAPFHEFDGQVSDELKAELAEIEQGLAAGTLSTAGEVTEAPEVEPLAAVEAPDCDYGGKIKSIKALDQYTVQFEMCRPDPAFLSKAAFIPFAIWPKEYLEQTGGTGELLEMPIGTGPYYVESWNRGDSIVFKRFDDYWGKPAIAETMVLRWASEGAARLLELQAGTVDQITNVPPDDYETVKNDPNLQFLPRSNPNILYLGMCNLNEPFDNLQVRQAIAMGIDRQRIVDNFYPEGSIVPTHFTPCSIPNGCVGDPWYEFDPDAARDLLAEAGFPDGFETTIHYRDVFRGYLPEPGVVAVEFQTQLRENLGIEAEVIVMESGEFIDKSTTCDLPGFYLLGWGADYPHVTNFLDFHFGRSTLQFGDPHPEIYEPLEAGAQIGDPAAAEAYYVEANNAIRELVPMVPIANGAEAQAARAGIDTHTRPFGASVYGPAVDTGSDTFVFMQNAEPISLYCGDESDGESLYACEMVLEPLLLYAMDSGDTVPALATSCEANADSTVWTCYLREGVKFHDGSDFDAEDVVASWAMGIDAANPLHIGNTGTFQYYSYLWDVLMNAEE
jgi:ABC-type transport system substrate-binding protein/basic membrane lipoprotein Med (substrate-binding protein (PBP1-ABC) superfamily)